MSVEKKPAIRKRWIRFTRRHAFLAAWDSKLGCFPDCGRFRGPIGRIERLFALGNYDVVHVSISVLILKIVAQVAIFPARLIRM